MYGTRPTRIDEGFSAPVTGGVGVSRSVEERARKSTPRPFLKKRLRGFWTGPRWRAVAVGD